VFNFLEIGGKMTEVVWHLTVLPKNGQKFAEVFCRQF